MPQQATSGTLTAGESFVGKLAQFFPESTPVRIPVRITAMARGRKLAEQAVLEYGTPTEVLFASSLPLEFDDLVHLENADQSLEADATVVAVQYHNGRMAVAVRFARRVPNWIIQT